MKPRARIVHVTEETAAELVPALNEACGLAPFPIEGTEWWITYLGKEAVAYLGLQVSVLPAFAGLSWIPRTGVLPQARGGGLETKMARRALAWARAQRGLVGCVTYTVNNPASATSLIRAGFLPYEPEGPWAEKGAAYWRVRF
jgi:hypothetical protein